MSEKSTKNFKEGNINIKILVNWYHLLLFTSISQFPLLKSIIIDGLK